MLNNSHNSCSARRALTAARTLRGGSSAPALRSMIPNAISAPVGALDEQAKTAEAQMKLVGACESSATLAKCRSL
jgi:hypothetical protein